MNEQKCIELNVGLPDRGEMLKMERCAEFLARMIEKYGREVLDDGYDKDYEKLQGETDRVYDRIEKAETEMEGKMKKLSAAKQGIQAADRVEGLLKHMICVEDGIDSSKDSGKLTITVLPTVVEIEWENILVQTMEGRKQKAREGKWNGGLDSKTSTLMVESEEAAVVKIIYEKFVQEGMGADSICNYLNQRRYAKQKNREFELNYFFVAHHAGAGQSGVYRENHL